MFYLYIKQCSHCDLKYFGFTARYNPVTYSGSGTYWKRHLRCHDALAITLDVFGFDKSTDCQLFALDYSQQHNIAKSNEWANLQIECGQAGKLHWRAPKKPKVKKEKIPYLRTDALVRIHHIVNLRRHGLKLREIGFMYGITKARAEQLTKHPASTWPLLTFVN